VVVTALTFGATVDQLAKLDLGYAPPFNTAIDILAHAANLIRNKRDGLAVAIAPDLVHEKLDQNDDFVLLDVRTPDEYGARHVDHSNVTLVPLGKLRERMAELPKDKPIVTVCQLGLRSYEAQTILAGAGFKDVKFMEGGFHAWPFELVTE
jgi:rhodanese-related sulfurtransferase